MIIDFQTFKTTGKRKAPKSISKKNKTPTEAQTMKFLHDTIDEMVQALLFYADDTNYHIAVGKDLGEKAQLALYGKKLQNRLTSKI
jgi:hypothetical protein